MASIKINTGLKTYDIEDENGNIRGQITINPKDMNFMPRAQQMKKNISNWLESIDKLPENLTEEEMSEKMLQYDNLIKSEINTLFADDVSSVVFGSQSAFNTLNGVTFVERFLQAIMPVIEEEFAKEHAKSTERIQKYTKQVN